MQRPRRDQLALQRRGRVAARRDSNSGRRRVLNRSGRRRAETPSVPARRPARAEHRWRLFGVQATHLAEQVGHRAGQVQPLRVEASAALRRGTGRAHQRRRLRLARRRPARALEVVAGCSRKCAWRFCGRRAARRAGGSRRSSWQPCGGSGRWPSRSACAALPALVAGARRRVRRRRRPAAPASPGLGIEINREVGRERQCSRSRCASAWPPAPTPCCRAPGRHAAVRRPATPAAAHLGCDPAPCAATAGARRPRCAVCSGAAFSEARRRASQRRARDQRRIPAAVDTEPGQADRRLAVPDRLRRGPPAATPNGGFRAQQPASTGCRPARQQILGRGRRAAARASRDGAVSWSAELRPAGRGDLGGRREQVHVGSAAMSTVAVSTCTRCARGEAQIVR